MPYKLRKFRCVDCRIRVLKKAAANAEVRCTTHAVAYSVEVQRQLAARSGPHYQRWVIANLAAAQRVLASPAPGEWPTAM